MSDGSIRGPNVPVNVIASNAASSLVRIHFLHTELVARYNNFVVDPDHENLTQRKFYTRNIFNTKISRSTVYSNAYSP